MLNQLLDRNATTTAEKAYRLALDVPVKDGSVGELADVSHADTGPLLGFSTIADLDILDLQATGDFPLLRLLGDFLLLLLLWGLLRGLGSWSRNGLAILSLELLSLLVLGLLGLFSCDVGVAGTLSGLGGLFNDLLEAAMKNELRI